MNDLVALNLVAYIFSPLDLRARVIAENAVLDLFVVLHEPLVVKDLVLLLGLPLELLLVDLPHHHLAIP